MRPPPPHPQKSSPTEYFWYRETLEISPDINHPERFNWKIAICLLVAWVLTYLCMAKGIASSGKVSDKQVEGLIGRLKMTEN